MTNRRELKDARLKAAVAAWTLRAIEALPRRVGTRVLWSNGVIWIRQGDDAWNTVYDGVPSDDPSYSSEHIATAAGSFHDWSVIDPKGRIRRVYRPWA